MAIQYMETAEKDSKFGEFRLSFLQVDHFGDHRGTFPQRLCIYDKWWRNATASALAAPAVVGGGEGEMRCAS